jgi:hypothetical protein
MPTDLNVTGQIELTSVEPAEQSPGDKKPDSVETPEDKTADTAATALATGLTLLAAGLGVFGGLTGSVARMARNHQSLTAIAVALVLAAVVLALASRLVRSTTTWPKTKPNRPGSVRVYRLLLWVSLGCFVLGLGLAMVTLNDSIGTADRPSIATTATRDAAGNVTVAGTAKASGLKATDEVYVYMFAFSSKDSTGEQVYYSLVGPDSDGQVGHAFSVIVDLGVDSVLVTAGRKSDDPKTCEPPPTPLASQPASPSPTPEVVQPPNDLTACALVSIGGAPPMPTAGP